MCCLSAVGMAPLAADDPPKEPVGAIEGEAVTVEGPMKMDVAGSQLRTVLLSGSKIQVKSGTARIELVEGGQIAICGPAHLSVLKSGGALTVALESGTIHARIERAPALTVYTPQIQASPVAIGDAARDTLVGLNAAGAMCIRAASGAVRVEQQLSGQSVIVPQGGEVQLLNGQIDSLRPGGPHCACELQTAKAPPPEMSQIATAAEARQKNPPPQPAPEKPAVKEEPVYEVFMPPLAYDATAKVQPEPDPRLIVLVRRVRVRPTLIFRGRVEGDAVAAAVAPPPAAAHAAKAPAASSSVVDRVRNFFRQLWSKDS